jgi:hypothetical protein
VMLPNQSAVIGRTTLDHLVTQTTSNFSLVIVVHIARDEETVEGMRSGVSLDIRNGR